MKDGCLQLAAAGPAGGTTLHSSHMGIRTALQACDLSYTRLIDGECVRVRRQALLAPTGWHWVALGCAACADVRAVHVAQGCIIA